MSSPRLDLDALGHLQPTSFRGTVYRAVLKHHKDQLLSTEGNRYAPGRYHTKGEAGILYTSLTRHTALKEIERHALPATLQAGIVIGKINICLRKILDLTDKAILHRLHLTQEMLVTHEWSTNQAISILVRRAGFQGLITPSATDEGDNLIVFENNFGEGCSLEIEEVLEMESS